MSKSYRPFWERGVGSRAPRTAPCTVEVNSKLEKRDGLYYLSLWVLRARIGTGLGRGSGRYYSISSIQENPDTIVYGPEENKYFLDRSRPILEAEATKHFERIAYEYVNFDRPVEIRIYRI